MLRSEKRQAVARVRKKYERLSREFDERQRRLWAASEAAEIGYGGIVTVSEATGLARSTIGIGLRDLSRPGRRPTVRRVRRKGGGRKKLTDQQPGLKAALDKLIEPTTRGDPESPLRWTTKSTRRLADELRRQGFEVSHVKVGELLKESGYSLQSNRKSIEGKQHPDRNAQFEFIADEATEAHAAGQPMISVDTKKKELIGQYKNNGREWHPKGQPELTKTHDFPDKELGKAIPYGIYDLKLNSGWVNVGMSADTAEFAVASIERWWVNMGRTAYPDATQIFITADAGGSNSYRTRLWKVSLQDFANRTGLNVKVSHFPPGTSKWNKIEHRMFCHISQNWRGRPLTTHAAVVSLIAATTTKSGLTINAALDQREYEKGVKVSDEELERVRLVPAAFHGEWNYTILPTDDSATQGA
jgi:transposase